MKGSIGTATTTHRLKARTWKTGGKKSKRIFCSSCRKFTEEGHYITRTSSGLYKHVNCKIPAQAPGGATHRKTYKKKAKGDKKSPASS